MSGTVSYLGNKLTTGTGAGINLDAWGKQKVVEDYSLLHSLFTYSVPVANYRELFNSVERTSFVNATSVNGKLNIVAGATLNDETQLKSFKHPRYEPNRGHIYSVSAFLPSPTAAGQRDFGLFTTESGLFFRLKSDGKLYGVRRTTTSGGGTVDAEEEITIPFPFDFEKGNTYDIQFQWRGVGNVKFYVGDAATGLSTLVHEMKLLNTLTELSVFNPALPIGFACKNLGDNVVFECGCVDVSSEGGKNYDGTYGSISTSTNSGSVAITGFNAPVIAVHSKEIFLGHVNTRDILNLSLTAYSDQKSVVRVWITRDSTAITLGTQSYIDYRDGNLEYVEYDPGAGTPMTFDKTKAELQFNSRIAQDIPFPTDAVFNKAASLNITPGDYIIFTIHRESGTAANVGLTYEFSEEI